MKLKSCFLFMCMVAAMLACSDNDDPAEQPKTPVVPNATLALTAQTADRIITKALESDTENTTGDGAIAKLTLVVFNAGAYTSNGYKVGDVVFTATKSMTNPDENAISEISGMGLLAGSVEMLLIANAEEALTDEFAKMINTNTSAGSHLNKDDVLKLTTTLTHEVEYTDSSSKGLTMIKMLTEIELKAGDNYIGFADNKGGAVPNVAGATDLYGKVELVRTVARVELNKLTLTSSNEYKSISFLPTAVFVANVKSLAGISDNVEVTYNGEADFYRVGLESWTVKEGIYKKGTAAYLSSLFAGITGNALLELNSSDKAEHSSTALKEIGNKYFYVYPNTKGERTAPIAETKADNEKNYTLLVVKGNYEHSVNGKSVMENDRYYTVVVNDTRFGAQNNEYVSRNTKYWVNLTIAGSGSDAPYDPAAFAHISAKIEVTKWNVIKIDETVD